MKPRNIKYPGNQRTKTIQEIKIWQSRKSKYEKYPGN